MILVRPKARLQGLRSNGEGKRRRVETTLRSLVNRKTVSHQMGMWSEWRALKIIF